MTYNLDNNSQLATTLPLGTLADSVYQAGFTDV